MNYYEHHIGDYAEATAHLSFIEDAAYSRLIRKYYATEKPLPADPKAVQRLVGARSKEEREAVTTVLDEFFTLHEDGWHNARCDEEIARYQDKQAKAKRSAEARWSKPRTHSEGNANASPDAMRTHSEGNAHQTPDTSHQSPVDKDTHRPTTGETPLEGQPKPVSRTTAICFAMRAAGLATVNPSHPDLPVLIEQGAEIGMFEQAARQAAQKGKSFAYAIGIVKGQIADAKATANVQHNPAGSNRPTRFDPVAFVNQAHKEQGDVIDVAAQRLA